MNILGRPFKEFVTDQINIRQDSLKKGIGKKVLHETITNCYI